MYGGVLLNDLHSLILRRINYKVRYKTPRRNIQIIVKQYARPPIPFSVMN